MNVEPKISTSTRFTQRNVQKSVMHVQKCYFANLNLLVYCRSSCCHCRHCLSSLLAVSQMNLKIFILHLAKAHAVSFFKNFFLSLYSKCMHLLQVKESHQLLTLT